MLSKSEINARYKKRHPDRVKAMQDRYNQTPRRALLRAQSRRNHLQESHKKEAAYYRKTRDAYRRRAYIRRDTHKRRYLMHMGGMRCKCGFTSDICAQFEFHHVDPKIKSFNLGNAIPNPYPDPMILEELKKCVVMCCNCHAAVISRHPDATAIRVMHGLPEPEALSPADQNAVRQQHTG